ncbi:MAG: serine dehydratase [Ignavibacteria bacterium GWB2_35_12]|nr:MAG: serine dehydratase [Ignavibacteria bacterium GWB2_35_12]OGU86327.1 MAG: serine dehydratase [Ignavibacteria bacterium RIFOXYA2_FULL_35_10]OGV20093.1 MAG: serine dehydratase [Ignavibacteria bacterium RIFOXYC2_FULL_35_21]
MILILPSIDDVHKATERIKPIIHRTPVLSSKSINQIVGADIYFKCENFQKVGAFKFRGASNAVFSLTDEEIKRGVATHSSGNHAQALALAARIRGTKAYIVMPSNSSKVKIEAVKGYDAEIIFCEPTLEARESTLEDVVNKTGATFIHPYNNFNVISGQGTSAMELLDEIKDLDYVITPVGGGGLLSGTLTTVSALSPSTKVIAAEPEGADDAYRSIIENRIVPSVTPKTICDGLLTSLSEMTFEIIREHIYKIITVSDDAVVSAMRLIWERMKIIIEPSSAITLGIFLENKIDLKGHKIGIILSGGNVDLEKLPWTIK